MSEPNRQVSAEETDSRPFAGGPEIDRNRLPKIIAFHELCRCGDEIWIENGGQLYRLRRTRQGKLILTK